jgi:hypothetical protein
MDSRDTVENNLSYLKRAGLIIEAAGQVYELDNYLYMPLKSALIEQN